MYMIVCIIQKILYVEKLCIFNIQKCVFCFKKCVYWMYKIEKLCTFFFIWKIMYIEYTEFGTFFDEPCTLSGHYCVHWMYWIE